MLNYIILSIYLCLSCQIVKGFVHSLVLDPISASDSIRVKLLNAECWKYRESDPWRSVRLGYQALEIAQKINFARGEAQVDNYIGVSFMKMEDYVTASKYFFKALDVSERNKIQVEKAYALNNIGNLLIIQGDYKQALNFTRQALQLQQQLKNETGVAYAYIRMSEVYRGMQLFDSMLYVSQLAYNIRIRLNDREALLACQRQISQAYEGKGQFDIALKYATKVSSLWRSISNYYSDLARIYLRMGKFDSSIYYGLKSLQVNERGNIYTLENLSDAYQGKGDWRNAMKYTKIANQLRDSIAKVASYKHTQNLLILYETREKEQENASLKMKLHTNLILSYCALLIAVIGLCVAWFFFRMRKHEKATNLLLNMKNEEISAQRDSLEDLNNTKNKFFSIIAHDLRGPIANMNAFLNHIINEKKDISPDHMEEYLHLIRDSTETIHKLLESLLTWARSQRGEIKYEPTPCQLSELIQTNVDLFISSARRKNIELQIEQVADIMVVADYKMISTVIRNLVNNAIKYTKDGGRVAVAVEVFENAVAVNVCDSGIGMERDYLAQIFSLDAKHRSKTGTSGEKGTGLGLILCKEFLEMHGSELRIESSPGSGSSFKFNLPRIK